MIGKRLFDVSVVVFSVPVILPLLGFLAVVIWISMGSPIIFSQSRGGLRGKVIRVYKFRTMNEARDESGVLLSDARRITKLGQFLRSSSLDELPSLANVLKGDMSIVGPRPLIADYLPLYTPAQSRRHEVRPGITGWAQVNGRNAITWEEKFDLDVWYVENRSMFLDIRIIFMTLYSVFRRRGISAPGDATMPRFTGTRKP